MWKNGLLNGWATITEKDHNYGEEDDPYDEEDDDEESGNNIDYYIDH